MDVELAEPVEGGVAPEVGSQGFDVDPVLADNSAPVLSGAVDHQVGTASSVEVGDFDVLVLLNEAFHHVTEAVLGLVEVFDLVGVVVGHVDFRLLG